MPRYFLRVEGVNHADVIDDTDDLSTRRGGGLMLLNAVRQLLDNVSPSELRTRLQPVATGASVGLFAFDSAEDAETVRKQVADHFRTDTFEYPIGDGKTKHLKLEYATFVVDVEPEGADADRAVQQVTAANRWRQMQQPGVSLADLWPEKPAARECQQDCVRPADPALRLPKDQKNAVSPSVYGRHLYGRDARQKFYDEFTARRLKFTDTFAGIGDRKPLDPKDRLQPTHDKLAVLYLDGNGFGKDGRTALREGGTDRYQSWSDGIRAHHKTLLSELLDRIHDQPEWRNDGNIRLETLLWGGDEILWIVPAWKGWELAEWFFGHPSHGGRTYSGGLVFCHTKTPIQNVAALAHRLGDLAKGTNQHRLAYEVLESFDDIHADLDDHRRLWLPADEPTERLLLEPSKMAAVWPAVRAIAACHDFPTRQLYMAGRGWRAGGDIEPHVKRMTAAGVTAELDALRAAFGGSPVAYLHLLQMLPYIPTAGAAS